MKGGAVIGLAALLTALGTILISCELAFSMGHVKGYPQISMCGMFPPERYVFTLGFTLTSVLLAVLLVLNHSKNERQQLRLAGDDTGCWARVGSGLHLGLGLSATVNLSLMGTVPVSEFPVPHVLFAAAFFLLVVCFQAINCFLRIYRVIGEWRAYSSRQKTNVAITETWMVVWMILTFIGFVMWQVTGKSGPQYLAVLSVFMHFFPYLWELGDVTVQLSIPLSGEVQDEAASPLIDSGAESQNYSPKRSPLIISTFTILVVLALLALVISHLQLDTVGQEMQQMMKKPRQRPPENEHLAIYRYRGPR